MRKSSCWQRYFLHDAVLPPPVSLRIALRLLALSQVASGWKALLMLSVTHSVCVPELSESRYSGRKGQVSPVSSLDMSGRAYCARR